MTLVSELESTILRNTPPNKWTNADSIQTMLPMVNDIENLAEAVDAINSGTVTLTDVTVAVGAAATPSINYAADTTTGLYSPAAGQVAMSSAGVGQIILKDGVIEPVTDNDIDLGTASKEFKNLYVQGTVISSNATASTSKDTGSIVTEGGVGVELAIFAGTTINAGTGLTVGTDVTLAKEVNHNLIVATTTTAATAGGNLVISPGIGATSGSGGLLSIQGAAGGATGTGGNVGITSGPGGGTSGNSGAINILTSNETSTDLSGLISVNTGTTASANSGLITIVTGAVSTSGNSGAATLGSGVSTTAGNSGLTTVSTGNVGTGDSGNVALSTGTSTVGGTGDITLTTGNTASGLAGDIILTPGTHTSATVSPIISLNKAVVKKPNSSTVASGATITGPELVGGLIAATGATGNWQLPTAAQITTAIGSTPAGTNFEFIFNAAAMTGTNTATLVVGTNMSVASAPAITGGGALTVTQDTQVTGTFKIVYDTPTTCKIYRIA